MQKNNAIIIIGSPGSGKDVVIRDISSNYNIVEFTSVQIDEMLSDDAAFKRAKVEKRDSLLERASIIVTANSYDLGFILTKQVLESIGYTTHLIYVEANLSTSFERLYNRSNIKESFDRISMGNNNKQSILESFSSKITVNNSEVLDLSECRSFVYDILSELSFKTDLTLEDIKRVDLKKKIKPTVQSKLPGAMADTRGAETGGVWTTYCGVSEWFDPYLSPSVGTVTNTNTLSGNSTSGGQTADLSSDQEKEYRKKVLNKIKKINFKPVIPTMVQ